MLVEVGLVGVLVGFVIWKFVDEWWCEWCKFWIDVVEGCLLWYVWLGEFIKGDMGDMGLYGLILGVCDKCCVWGDMLDFWVELYCCGFEFVMVLVLFCIFFILDLVLFLYVWVVFFVFVFKLLVLFWSCLIFCYVLSCFFIEFKLRVLMNIEVWFIFKSIFFVIFWFWNIL